MRIWASNYNYCLNLSFLKIKKSAYDWSEGARSGISLVGDGQTWSPPGQIRLEMARCQSGWSGCPWPPIILDLNILCFFCIFFIEDMGCPYDDEFHMKMGNFSLIKITKFIMV